MKFVKITEHNQLFWDLLKQDPTCMAAPLQAHYDGLKKMKEEGHFVEGYYMPGDGRSIQIFDFDNESELDNNFLQDPMTPFFDIEIFGGVPLFEHIENALKTMQ